MVVEGGWRRRVQVPAGTDFFLYTFEKIQNQFHKKFINFHWSNELKKTVERFKLIYRRKNDFFSFGIWTYYTRLVIPLGGINAALTSIRYTRILYKKIYIIFFFWFIRVFFYCFCVWAYFKNKNTIFLHVDVSKNKKK